MNKTDFIERIAEDAGISKTDAGNALNAVLDNIVVTLKNGDRVVLPGFGTFETSNRAARTGRNPQTGEVIQIEAARVAKFKAGKALRDAIKED